MGVRGTDRAGRKARRELMQEGGGKGMGRGWKGIGRP